MRWCEVKPDRSALIDAKTGPRHALLAEAGRKLLHCLAETASGEWVFPGDRGPDREVRMICGGSESRCATRP